MKNIFNSVILGTAIAIIIFGFGESALSQEKKGVTVAVELSPAGSFEIQGNRFRGGKLLKEGGSYSLSELKIKSKDLKTGLDLRDEHMRKRLGEEIIIHSARGLGGEGKGLIEINKVKREFKFNYTPSSNHKFLVAQFELKISDFNITDVSYMGVGVKDTLKVKALMPIND